MEFLIISTVLLCVSSSVSSNINVNEDTPNTILQHYSNKVYNIYTSLGQYLREIEIVIAPGLQEQKSNMCLGSLKSVISVILDDYYFLSSVVICIYNNKISPQIKK